MRRFEHGGNVWAHPGCLDFSASLNPLGMPRAVRESLRLHVDDFALYPDPNCEELTRAIAAHEGVDERHVLVCAGATDALARVHQVLRPRRVLLCAPSYLGYEQAAEQVGARVVHHLLREEEDFAVGKDVLDALDSDIDLMVLANPNNPTGLYLSRELLVACLRRASDLGVTMVLDECFADLGTPDAPGAPGELGAADELRGAELRGATEEPGTPDDPRGTTDEPRTTDARHGSQCLLEDFPQLVIVKAFTKSYALAGLRLGYVLCADEGLLDRMRAAGQTWAVSTPAQIAGLACFADEGYLATSRELIERERAYLIDELRSLGLRVVEGQANYLLFRAHAELGRDLRERGLLVRSCANFVGLGDAWYRIAVRTHQENERLVAALREVL